MVLPSAYAPTAHSTSTVGNRAHFGTATTRSAQRLPSAMMSTIIGCAIRYAAKMP